MSNSREDSPDWLRSFQPPTKSAIELSSGSVTPSEHSVSSDEEDDSINLSKLFKKQASRISDIDDNGDGRESTFSKPVKGKSPEKTKNVKQTPERKRKKNDDHEKKGAKALRNGAKRTPKKHGQPHVKNHSIWALSSDSEPTPNASPARRDGLEKESKKDKDYDFLEKDGESPINQASNVKSPRKKMVKEEEKISKERNVYSDKIEENDAKNNAVREDVSSKNPGPQISSSRLPLLLSEKVQRLKALVECEGDSIDLSGDVGAVGRVVISDDLSNNHEMFLDLKGTIYKTNIVPSRTFCVVSFSQSEAKIEAIMNDFIQLKPQSNVYEAETMVEGTLDGFSFDSEDEIDNLPKAIAQTDEIDAAEDQPVGKTKRAKKTSGVTRKIGKSAAGKPNKKVKKKPLVPKQRKGKK
ncbi:uncharacterized protein [Primulina huaijiensis]|uniref:uncharacterized protein isoform X1 n=1 Tax=Primulina huaijiensis TaxID=1492673 RepID=UPI003CC72BEF